MMKLSATPTHVAVVADDDPSATGYIGGVIQPFRPISLHPDDWVEIDGLLTNIVKGRFDLMRKGERVELTTDEMVAIDRFKRARLGICP